MPSIEFVFVALSAFLLLAIVGSKAATRTGVPVLLLFLALGMLAGSDGLGGFYFDNPALAQSVGVVALAFILFSGGLNTPWKDVRPVLKQGLALSTLGVTLTALCVGWFALTFLGFTLAEGVLLGAIIASTDAAAVFAVLNSKSVRLRGRLKELLELESGSNDPMAVFLTVGVLQLITNPGQSPLSLIPMFVLQMGLGALIGLGIGRGARLAHQQAAAGIRRVVSRAFACIGARHLRDYGAGGGQRLFGRLSGRVGDGAARFRAQAQPGAVSRRAGVADADRDVCDAGPAGLSVTAAKRCLGRIVCRGLLDLLRSPVECLSRPGADAVEPARKAVCSWVGLRGAAPIVLATFPVLAGVAKADTIFHLVFFIVLTSVLVQGTLIIPMAKWLKVYDATPPPSPLAYVMRDRAIANDLREIHVLPDAPAVGKQIVDLHLPPDVLIVLIGRGDDMIALVLGSTVISSKTRCW